MSDVVMGIILGVVQGLTEFIPVSSSGHLILVREFLGISLPEDLAFDAVLHLATACAIAVYFRHELIALVRAPEEIGSKILWGALVFGTLPAVLVGYFFGDVIAAYTRSAEMVAWTLLLGSLLFVLAERLTSRPRTFTPLTGFGVGLFQTLALVPGMSRSGAAIAGGLLSGVDRESATRFAFLLGFPILLGVGGMKLVELFQNGAIESLGMPLFTAALAAFGVGMISIHAMIAFLRRFPLYVFAAYRVLLAAAVFFFV